MKKSYVYKITCLVTGEYYFGSSFRANSDSYWGGGRKIRERIAQYGKENFVKEILEEFDDRVEANKKENQYIEKFRNDDKCLNQMLNRHFGSNSDERCAKISAANRGEKSPWYGKHFSEEHRAKMSAAKRGENHPMYGKHLSEETKAKIGDANRGKHHTYETKAKIGDSLRGEKNPMYGKHLSEEHRAKIGAANAVSQLGKHHTDETRAKLSAALRGKPQQHRKHWRKNPVTGKREYYD